MVVQTTKREASRQASSQAGRRHSLTHSHSFLSRVASRRMRKWRRHADRLAPPPSCRRACSKSCCFVLCYTHVVCACCWLLLLFEHAANQTSETDHARTHARSRCSHCYSSGSSAAMLELEHLAQSDDRTVPSRSSKVWAAAIRPIDSDKSQRDASTTTTTTTSQVKDKARCVSYCTSSSQSCSTCIELWCSHLL